LDRDLSRAEKAGLSAIAGLQAVSLYVLAVGLCGMLSARWLFFAPAAAAMAFVLVLAWKRRRERAESAPIDEGWLGPRDPRELWWLLAAAPFAAVLVLGALLPPVDFDVREYHLEVPKEWYLAGRIGHVPHNVYGNMPLGAEMPALAAMCLMKSWW